MRLKQFKPTYNMLEVMIEGESIIETIASMQLLSLKTARRKYGMYEVLSYRDFHDTETTSVILFNAEKLN